MNTLTEHYAFIDLVKQNKVLSMDKYLADHPGLNMNFHDGAPLRMAIVRENYEAVLFLLMKKANPNVMGGYCLGLAASSGNHTILLSLLEFGGRSEVVNNFATLEKLHDLKDKGFITQRIFDDIIFMIQKYSEIQNN